MQGYNDDLTLSLCMGLWVRDTALRFRSENVQTQKSLFDYMGSSNQLDSTPFGQSGLSTNPYEINTAHGKKENINWLF